MASKELKHLEVVKKAATVSFLMVTILYDIAKENSGSLKSAVGTVESAVNTAVSPLRGSFFAVSDKILGFFDDKVDEVAPKLEEKAPSTAKELVKKANQLIHMAVDKAEELVSIVKNDGPQAGYDHAAQESREIFVAMTVEGLILLDQHKTLQKVGKFIFGAAELQATKYNQVIRSLSGKGYSVFNYFPLVPVKEIKKAYETEKKGACPNF